MVEEGTPPPPEPSSRNGLPFTDIYVLGDKLGEGAFSTVKVCTHKNAPKNNYAVKIVDKEILTPEDLTALLDEVSILFQLKRCPHITTLYDFFEEKTHYYLVMEIMGGGELFDRIVKKSYYNESEARGVCKILLESVAFCHDNRVTHRDLKPENLLLRSLTDDMSIKLADFGFAKVVKEPNSLTTQCGTPGYVAPEILNGVPYDEAADMWSVGVILYILLGGYPPFIDDNQRRLFRKIRKGKYEFHAEYWDPISDDAKILISHLLCVNADERLSAREALQSNWISVASDEELNKNDMLANLTKLRQFNGRRKFRAAVASVLAVNKMANFLAFDTFQMDDMELPMLKAKSTKKIKSGRKSGRKSVKVYGDEEEA